MNHWKFLLFVLFTANLFAQAPATTNPPAAVGHPPTQTSTSSGDLWEVVYPPSTKEGELVFGVTYTLWIPQGVKTIRGVIVHQHGCGTGACKGGETAAFDLHWQALAAKWNCALLGPSYHQQDMQNCRLWCDPRNGSEQTFLRSLTEFAEAAKHPELTTAPWCLWGHSGGAFWGSIMQVRHPERVIAVWLRSGTAFGYWEKGEIPKPEIPPTAYAIPTVCNPGAKENGDKRFSAAWDGGLAMFKAYRREGALIAFAPDPRTAHECGDSRYLAIPFFDACLEQRLPETGTTLRPANKERTWLAAVHSDVAEPLAKFKGEVKEASWLPSERVAKAFSEYVRTGFVEDASPPPAPTNVQLQENVLTWDAQADFESGVGYFEIERNGKKIGQVPEKPLGKFGRPLFQSMSYHDTPERPLPEMRFTDANPPATKEPAEYRVITVNGSGLKSQPAVAKRQQP